MHVYTSTIYSIHIVLLVEERAHAPGVVSSRLLVDHIYTQSVAANREERAHAPGVVSSVTRTNLTHIHQNNQRLAYKMII